MKINCELIETKLQLHEYIAKELSFPEYYGKNLDALYDLLTERREETLIELINFEKLRKTFGIYADAFLDVLHDASEENKNIKFTLN